MLVQVSTKVKWLLSVLETVSRPLLYASILFHKPKATSYNYQSQKKEFFEKRQLRRAEVLLCTTIFPRLMFRESLLIENKIDID